MLKISLSSKHDHTHQYSIVEYKNDTPLPKIIRDILHYCWSILSDTSPTMKYIRYSGVSKSLAEKCYFVLLLTFHWVKLNWLRSIKMEYLIKMNILVSISENYIFWLNKLKKRVILVENYII